MYFTKWMKPLHGLKNSIKEFVRMNSNRKLKQKLIDHLEVKRLGIDTIPSFIRSMRICFNINSQMNHLEINRYLKSFGWNDIEVDRHTLQLSTAFFKAEGNLRFQA